MQKNSTRKQKLNQKAEKNIKTQLVVSYMVIKGAPQLFFIWWVIGKGGV
jgi:hypothetical protein